MKKSKHARVHSTKESQASKQSTNEIAKLMGDNVKKKK